MDLVGVEEKEALAECGVGHAFALAGSVAFGPAEGVEERGSDAFVRELDGPSTHG
jgi:hypothetical protein